MIYSKRLLSNSLLSLVFCVTTILFNSISAQVEYESTLNIEDRSIGFNLNWSTSAEYNNKVYIVERSTNGKDFKNIGTVDSKENRKLNEYNFEDFELGLNEVTYRLKQINADGTSSLSEAYQCKKQIVRNFTTVEKTEITNEIFEFTLNSIIEGQLSYTVLNSESIEAIKDEQLFQIGLNKVLVNMESELDGDYMITFKVGAESETFNFTKTTTTKKGNVATKSMKSGG